MLWPRHQCDLFRPTRGLIGHAQVTMTGAGELANVSVARFAVNAEFGAPGAASHGSTAPARLPLLEVWRGAVRRQVVAPHRRGRESSVKNRGTTGSRRRHDDAASPREREKEHERVAAPPRPRRPDRRPGPTSPTAPRRRPSPTRATPRRRLPAPTSPSSTWVTLKAARASRSRTENLYRSARSYCSTTTRTTYSGGRSRRCACRARSRRGRRKRLFFST